MERKVTKFKWDRGVEYNKMMAKLKKMISEFRNSNKISDIQKLAYLVIATIQLRNGLRASESIEAFFNFLNNNYINENGKKITSVKIRKKRNEEYREVIYPECIPFEIINFLKKFKLTISDKSYEMFCIRKLNVNSHSLRYARITYLVLKGINPSLIAKITGHSKLDFILEYTQEEIARKINREIM